ncbi:hypothetical protein EGW08_017854 [Elysia chlorotica]|uniref:G-protein coupled receptors family 1 profile domain-containing protein n=1 Tax=Elysia chlorotica TaxID=188477 RepID=A0A3S1AWY9_ELYCH|nr:hypothetical protein EGW08_017854 [Elysia chlorotica]
MSSNISNSTDSTDSTHSISLPQDWITAFKVSIVTETIFVVAGVLLNTWIIASILSSKPIRAVFRNQIICAILVVGLVDDLAVSPVFISSTYLILTKMTYLACAWETFLDTMRIICSFVQDYLVVALSLVFLAQVLAFDPNSKFSPRKILIGKALVLAFPWAFAIIASPLSLRGISLEGFECVILDARKMYMIESAFTITPLAVAGLVFATAVVIRCVRFNEGRITAQGNMGVQLMGSVPQVDGSLPYIVVWLVCVVCEIMYVVILFRLKFGKSHGIFVYLSLSIMQSARYVCLPLVFLLFTDIRQRVKIWRPWRPNVQESGIDLTVVYNREG